VFGGVDVLNTAESKGGAVSSPKPKGPPYSWQGGASAPPNEELGERLPRA